MIKTISHKENLKGILTVPGDKSISHRSIMLGAIACGITEIEGFLMGEDCLSTISCFQKMGIPIEVEAKKVTVHGKGLHGLTAPAKQLDIGNSGTSLRLLCGLLSAQNFDSTITGDDSIQKRPMDRVVLPLCQMGADICGIANEKLYAPLKITGKPLHGIHYTLPVASAQVKSAVILAGLYAKGTTIITEPEKTRDHTEIMLNYLGADIKVCKNDIICNPVSELYGKKIVIPGDISSAAYFITAGCICENSHITIKNVGINPTRTGIITALLQMGAAITIENEHICCGEKTGDIIAKSSSLKGITIGGALIPQLIDEIPIIAVAACFAEGTTIIKDAQELKVKESNRIKTIVTELKKFGADICETADGMIIHGTNSRNLTGCSVESYKDHRIAMSMAIAAKKASGKTTIHHAECVDISFPKFYDYIESI